MGHSMSIHQIREYVVVQPLLNIYTKFILCLEHHENKHILKISVALLILWCLNLAMRVVNFGKEGPATAIRNLTWIDLLYM